MTGYKKYVIISMLLIVIGLFIVLPSSFWAKILSSEKETTADGRIYTIYPIEKMDVWSHVLNYLGSVVIAIGLIFLHVTISCFLKKIG